MIEPRPDLEAIRRRVEAAVPGPWTWSWLDAPPSQIDDVPGWHVRLSMGLDGEHLRVLWPVGSVMEEWEEPSLVPSHQSGLIDAVAVPQANADFIAHARQDIPELLEYIAYLESVIDDQR